MKTNNGSDRISQGFTLNGLACRLRGSRGRRGFTLVEILITVSIIAILMAIAVPTYIGQRKSAARSEAVNNLTALRMILEQSSADRGFYCINPGPDNIVGTVDDIGPQDPAAPVGSVGANAAARLQVMQNWWPKFMPGMADSLNYEYTVQCPSIPTAGRPVPPDGGRSFTAYARPKAGTLVGKAAGDRTGDLWINDRNENNF